MSYPLMASVVQPGEPLGLLVDVLHRADQVSVAGVAAAHDCSPAHLYNLLDRARRALQPQRPGPVPGARAAAALDAEVVALRARCAEGEARLATLEAHLRDAVVLDAPRLARLEAVMAVHNVTFRAMHEILAVAFGARQAPAVGTLHAHVVALGRSARRLLDRARAQVCGHLACVAGDDVFLAGCAVKVVSEPRSNAVLNAGRWPWREGADWALWLEEFTALRLFISDLGTDLVGAVDGRGLPHIIDFWHEIEWWREHLFEPLNKEERTHRQRRDQARAKARRATCDADRREARNAAARAETARASAEAAFYRACEAEDLLRTLYAPLRPCGLPWTTATVAGVVAALDGTLATIPQSAAWAARKHVATNAARYGTHHVLFDAVPIQLRPGSPWCRDDVLRALAQAREAQRRANDMKSPVAAQIQADRAARALAAAVRRHCINHRAVTAAWVDLVDWPRRSSSGTESFNNRLRVLQVVQRTVSDERIALHALAFDLTPREAGRRRGVSPFQQLGIDFARDDRPWYDVLLDAAA